MRAMVIRDGDLVLNELDDPEPRPGELLVRVRGAGLNRADLVARRGLYQRGTSVRNPRSGAAPPREQVAGGELSGIVVDVGEGVERFSVGDRVMAFSWGAYAELARVDQRRALAVPEPVALLQAAGFPITFITAHDALATAGRLAPGEGVLVNAASSGVGVASLQLAHLLGASPVVAVCRSRDKLERVSEAGVPFDMGIATDEGGAADAILEASGGGGIDVIVDSVGGGALGLNLAVCALGGTHHQRRSGRWSPRRDRSR